MPRDNFYLTVEFAYNWDPEEYTGGRNFGYTACRIDDTYEISQLRVDGGISTNSPAP